MSLSTSPEVASSRDDDRRPVLVTGAAGKIGSYFAEHSHHLYRLRLTDRNFGDKAEAMRGYGETMTGSLNDLDFLKAACDGIDTVVHLAGNSSPSSVWRDLLDANIIGAYNAFVAARGAGCRRIVYASSIHAVSGYPADVQVKADEPVNPGDLYGVTKCFGEALGRYLAEQEGISFIALRIGTFQPRARLSDEASLSWVDSFVSRRDLNQLIRCSIDAENIRFAILHALSENRFKRLDISDARDLVGYAPQDDFTEEYPRMKELHLREKVYNANQSDPNQKSGIREDIL